ncbi:hypothetical protein [Streptomyces sp. CA-106110]|uniref:hypothetical protein n=1 Tax=Streptomyces sp. CA-106110 TaxID=3240044 RepID=UPI003D8E66F0
MDRLTTRSRHLVVGAPGARKSALLRRLVLDVLADEPELVTGADRLQNVLPLWLPFAFYTNAVRQDRDCASVLGAVQSRLNTCDHSDPWHLVRKAQEDDRLLLTAQRRADLDALDMRW